tara:strand:- start:1206 stop:2252 length:1047 start_codon:yes stop_codon:yes gene_type:complete
MQGWSTDAPTAPGGSDAILEDVRVRKKPTSKGSTTNVWQVEDPNTTLIKACRAGSHSVPLLSRALEAGAAINQRDRWGYTPLHEVAKLGATAAAELLLDSAAMVDLADNDGYTPLHSAARAGHAQMVRLLLNAEADPNAHAIRSATTPLDVAVKHGHAEVVELITSTKGLELRGVEWTECNAVMKGTVATAWLAQKKQLAGGALSGGHHGGVASKLRAIDLDETAAAIGGASYADQLREALVLQAVRVIDLFLEWDADRNGLVSKAEFRKAMPLLGLEVPLEEIDALFDSWDPDGSGHLELKELNTLLRVKVQLDEKLQVGGGGAIQMESKNKHQIKSSAAQAKQKAR